jgi:hypothetical protein
VRAFPTQLDGSLGNEDYECSQAKSCCQIRKCDLLCQQRDVWVSFLYTIEVVPAKRSRRTEFLIIGKPGLWKRIQRSMNPADSKKL